MDYIRGVEIRDIPYYAWSDWDSVGMVKNAVRALEMGQLDMAAQLVDAMRRDDRVAGCLMTRAHGLPSLPINFKPAKGRRGKAIAKELEEEFKCMFPREELSDAIMWTVMLGMAFGELVWSTDEESTDGAARWTCRLKIHHPKFFYYNTATRSFWMNHMDGTCEVIPGNGQWVVFTAAALQKSYLYGQVRSLYTPWLLRQWSRRDAGRYSEVYGNPLRVVHTPKGGDKDDKARAAREITKIGTETTVVFPETESKDIPGYSIELIEADGKGFEGFLALGKDVGTDIAINLLGQNLTTEVSGGSFAAAKVHENIRADILAADAHLLGDVLREQALKPWAAFNFGDDKLAPTVDFMTDPPGDKTQDAVFMKTLGEGVAALKAVGAKIDLDKILEGSDVPTTGPTEEPEEKQMQLPLDEEAPKEKAPPEAEQLSAVSKRENMRGAVEAQLYIDTLADSATMEAARAATADIENLLAIVHASNGFDELKKNLTDAYKQMKPEVLALVMEKALILSELAGQVAILKDL